MKQEYTITKKIANPGKQAIIGIPTILTEKIRAGTIAKIKIDIIQEAREWIWSIWILRYVLKN